MKQAEAKIGMKVRVVPEYTNRSLPPPEVKTMYIREKHNPLCAGISYRQRERNQHRIYGVLWSVLYPSL